MSGRVALFLPSGGATGAMYQIGALAALEHALGPLDANGFDLYLGASSGASVCAVLAGGRPVERIYRAFLDPSDVYFGLERKHLLRLDLGEWRRTLVTTVGALRKGAGALMTSGAPPAALFEQLDRLYDSLPAGLFSLDAYERFLDDFFARRGVPNYFPGMPQMLRVLAYDLDSGEKVLFGAEGTAHVPVTRACIASMAVPPLFSPVRIGDRHYIDAGAAQVSLLDEAVAGGAEVIVVVNPMVPVRVDSVPTGHGRRGSIRDKGLLWVTNQSLRISIQALMSEACRRVEAEGRASVLMLEPNPSDGGLFMYNPANYEARRNILEHAYRATRAQLSEYLDRGHPALERAGWERRG